jgi:hypothetical protein
MAELKIDISELKKEGGGIIKEFADFLNEKTEADVEVSVDEIILKGEGKRLTKAYLRMILRKFLHKKELKDYYRVIGGRENTLMVKERKISEEE